MKSVSPNTGVRSYTIFWTFTLFVNKSGYWLRVSKSNIVNNAPITSEVIDTTNTESFALLGCPAPSSFDTLTLYDLT